MLHANCTLFTACISRRVRSHTSPSIEHEVTRRKKTEDSVRVVVSACDIVVSITLRTDLSTLVIDCQQDNEQTIDGETRRSSLNSDGRDTIRRNIHV
jgi:hypothetical protein